jgi:hypothetical protein
VPNLFRSDDERLRLLQDSPVIVVPVAQAFSNASISSSTVRERDEPSGMSAYTTESLIGVSGS